MTKITIKRRWLDNDCNYDYIAHISDNKAFWDHGETVTEAIGNLIITHANKLGIELVDPEHRIEDNEKNPY